MRGNIGLIGGGLGILAMVLFGSLGVASQSFGDQPSPASGFWMLPDTHAQQAVVSQYLHLIANGRYVAAWRLLTPSRQAEQPLDEFTAAWQARGQVFLPDGQGPWAKTFLWPAAIDKVRASFVIRQKQSSSVSSSEQKWSFALAQSEGAWRIAAEQPDTVLATEETPVGSPVEAVERAVRINYGSLYVPSVTILYDEPYEDGRVIIFRVLNPLLEPKEEGPRPAAILYYLRPVQGGWTFAGGGGIGTMIETGIDPVACAWTWLRLPTIENPQAPSTAAFYCEIEDPRVATIELRRVDGAIQRADVLGKQAAVFPYAASFQSRWPAQHQAAIRLFDASGRRLNLPTIPVGSQV